MFARPHATTAPAASFAYPLPRVGCGGLVEISEPLTWVPQKASGINVFGGVLHHPDLDAVVGRFAAMPWDQPDHVQLMVRDESDTRYRLFMIDTGGPACSSVLMDAECQRRELRS
jgi:hypothetical protein